MEPLSTKELRKEMAELITDGEFPYSVAIFGISTHYLSGTQTKVDARYLRFLENIRLNIPSAMEATDDDGALLELATFYYLLTQNQQAFQKGLEWMPKLTAKQKKKISTWPQKYVFSVFELIFKGTQVFSKNLIDGKEYLMVYSTTELDLQAPTSTIRMITILVPVEDAYLSAPPIFCPADDLLLAKLKQIKDKQTYGQTLLTQASQYVNNQIQQFMDEEAFEEERIFYPANKRFGETDKGLAKRLLRQSEFFQHYPNYEQAENFLVKVISTFPQLFFAQSDGLALIEALEMLFTDQEIEEAELPMMANDLSVFWYFLLKKHLPDDVAAVEPIDLNQMMDFGPFSDDELPF